MLLLLVAFQALAVGPQVSKPGNKHNLSALNLDPLVTYKATNDAVGNPRGQQICIFCHTPHNSNVEGQTPLWNRNFSSQNFQRYSSLTLQIRNSTKFPDAQYGASAQPNGSSKLCLSCHDGVSNLGAVLDGSPIAMTKDVITGFASFKPDTNKMKTGHHPVSFVYNGVVRDAIQFAKLPATVFTLPALSQVKLDKQSRMQCTTCHDAHQNMSSETDCYGGPCSSTNTRKIAPFWVYGTPSGGSADQLTVCLTCHPMTTPTSNPIWP
jgi:hypothetical protein